jgi:hypothetical protein
MPARRFLIAPFLFIVISAVRLPAQERSDTALYIAAASGGTQAQRQFFDDNIPMEVANANYKLVYTPAESDYIINMNLSQGEDYDNPGGTVNIFTITVVRTRTGAEVVRYSYDYQDVEEMYQWNLYIVYNALANVSLTNISAAPAAEDAPLPWWNTWVYLGFRAAPALTGYSYITVPNYPGDTSAGLGGEGGLTVEFRTFRFLSFQLDALLSWDGFTAPRIVSQEDSQTYTADDFGGLSVTIPFAVKVPLAFEKVVLSPYAGLYFTMIIGPLLMSRGGGPVEEVPAYKTLPLGFTAGADISFRAGRGEFSVDLRYYRDFGETIVQDGPRFTRDRITLSLAYKFGLLKRSPLTMPGAAKETPAEEPTEEADEEAL